MRFWVSALQAGEALPPSTNPVLNVSHTVSKRLGIEEPGDKLGSRQTLGCERHSTPVSASEPTEGQFILEPARQG